MQRLILTKTDIEACAEMALEILVDNRMSFTAHNITQIVRSLGVYVEHSTIRNYVRDLQLDPPYTIQTVVVGNEGATALLYTPINFKLQPHTLVEINLQSFDSILEEYREWFKDTYHFEIPQTLEAEEAPAEAPSSDISADAIREFEEMLVANPQLNKMLHRIFGR